MYRAEAIDKTAWDKFVLARDEANFLHSWQWGEVSERLGEVIVRQGIYKNTSLVGVLLGIVRDARRGRYLEVPGGPLIDWQDDEAVEFATDQLRRVASDHDCVFVRIRPQLLETPDALTRLKAHGYRRAPMHLHAEHTNIVSLEPSEDELLAGMRRQTRYEVRRSAKQGLEITYGNDTLAVESFHAMQADTAARQGFIPPSKALLAAQIAAFGDQARIYTASKDGHALNSALVLLYGHEAVYFEAASTPDARTYAGAYGLLWQAMCDARGFGCARINLWGIAYTSDPNHRYAGVTTFKRGFGGSDVTFVPAHDLVLRPAGYFKNWLVEIIRKKKRKL